jgi:hypothetical protein
MPENFFKTKRPTKPGFCAESAQSAQITVDSLFTYLYHLAQTVDFPRLMHLKSQRMATRLKGMSNLQEPDVTLRCFPQPSIQLASGHGDSFLVRGTGFLVRLQEVLENVQFGNGNGARGQR